MEKVKKILLLTSLVGILILLFLSQQLSPRLQEIANINESQIGERVQILGNIININDYSNNTFHVIQIEDSSGTIPVIFNTKSRELNLSYTKNYSVEGKLEKYNQTLQINVEKMEAA